MALNFSVPIFPFISRCLVYITVFATAFLVCVCSSNKTSWHPYDKDKTLPLKCSLPLLSGSSIKSDPKSWKLWPYLTQDDSFDSMIGFHRAMSAIWRNQHPDDCAKSKFLISFDCQSGFGSEVHLLGVGLAAAMNMNRVFIQLPSDFGLSNVPTKMKSFNSFQVNTSFCRAQGKENSECYFEPWTSCTIEDALGKDSKRGLEDLLLRNVNGRKAKTFAFVEQGKLSDSWTVMNSLRRRSFLGEWRYDLSSPSIWFHPSRTAILHCTNSGNNFIPESLRSWLECSQFHHKKYRYWWRAASAAFFLRPNEHTKKKFDEFRNRFGKKNKKKAQLLSKIGSSTHPCVSVYIRKGDKHVEMELREPQVYFKAAEDIWNRFNIGSSSSGGGGGGKSNPIMFIGSEDPAAIKEAKKWGLRHNWTVLHTNLFDRRDVSTWMNQTEQIQLRQRGLLKHHELEYLSMLYNLDIHLRCQAFVCAFGSNFCRIIDELRSTVAGKAHLPFADVSCSSPPCFEDLNVNWRK